MPRGELCTLIAHVVSGTWQQTFCASKSVESCSQFVQIRHELHSEVFLVFQGCFGHGLLVFFAFCGGNSLKLVICRVFFVQSRTALVSAAGRPVVAV